MRWPLTVVVCSPRKFLRRIAIGSAEEVLAADRDRIHLQRARDLVELHLEGEARLHAAVAALRPARRLVGEDARRVEAVGRERVGAGEELT